MKIKVLVTGANGQLAKTLKQLFSKNRDGILFSFLSKKYLDITSIDSVNRAFESNDYDYCINCAAFTDVEAAESDQKRAFSINAEGAKNIALACKSYNVKLIHISTDYIFDGSKKEPYTANDKANPINVYGKSKLQGEQNIQNIFEEFHIIRVSWLYSIYGKNFLKTIVNKINENAELRITISQKGTPTSCEDVSKFIYFLIKENLPFRTYNFSAQGSATWYDFAKEICSNYSNYDQKKLQPVNNYFTKAKRPKYSILDISKTESVYRPLNNWTESIKQTITQLRQVDSKS